MKMRVVSTTEITADEDFATACRAKLESLLARGALSIVFLVDVTKDHLVESVPDSSSLKFGAVMLAARAFDSFE